MKDPMLAQPWEAVTQRGFDGPSTIADADGRTLAFVASRFAQHPTKNPAAVMAAAPKMLALLRRLAKTDEPTHAQRVEVAEFLKLFPEENPCPKP